MFTIVRAGIAAADAGRLVSRALAASADARLLSSLPITVIAAGKAAFPMVRALVATSGAEVRAGLVVSSHLAGAAPRPFECHVAAHPVPDDESERAGRRALALASSTSGPLVVLLSGGASALMAVPAHDLELEDKKTVTARLLAAGADIHALNTVRKHLSAIKGGQLAAAHSPAPTLAFAVSDVVGDDLSVIASGPTVPDPSTFQDALDVLDRFGGRSTYPQAAVQVLDAGRVGARPETPKPGDARLSSTITRVIGSRLDVLAAAAEGAARAGYEPVVIEQPVVGEARQAAPAHVGRMVALARGTRGPAAVASAGETTVRVVGTGRGGRNQEFALAACPLLAALDRPAVFCSVGTDGIDGPTDAAGAVSDNTTLARIERAGLSVRGALEDNDSYTLFAALGDLIRTGPTDTNVGDLQVLLVG